MSPRQAKLRPMARSLAAVALLVWLAAQVVCAAHCNFGLCHADAEHASCHDSAQTQPHHDKGGSPAPAHDGSSTTAACLTLKSALVSDSGPALVSPQPHLVYTLTPLVLTLELNVSEPATCSRRQAQLRDWVFTPEVCLGPAHRSHAPPPPRLS